MLKCVASICKVALNSEDDDNGFGSSVCFMAIF